MYTSNILLKIYHLFLKQVPSKTKNIEKEEKQKEIDIKGCESFHHVSGVQKRVFWTVSALIQC